MHGDCALLALALNARTGWKIVEMYDQEDGIYHVAVHPPGDRFPDTAAELHSGYKPATRYHDVREDWWWARAHSAGPDVVADTDELLRLTGLVPEGGAAL